MNQQDHLERWLREAFHREGERIVGQMPRNLLARCLAAVRAEAEHGAEMVWRLRALDGLAVAIGVLVVIGIVHWMQRPPAQTAESIPVPPVRVQRLARGTVPSTNRISPVAPPLELAPPPTAVARSETPVTRPGELITPRFTQQLALARSTATGLNAGGLIPAGERPLPPARRESAGESGGILTAPPPPVVKTWDLEPATGQSRGSGVIMARGGAPKPAAGTARPTVDGLLLHASDLEPQTTYTVLVKLRDQPQPVVIGVVASDATGVVHTDLSTMPLASAVAGGTGHAPLLRAEDIVGVTVQDQQTGQVVLQTPVAGTPP
jgi:hypothetical protein